MAGLSDQLQQWRGALSGRLPAPLLSLLEGSSRRELLRQVKNLLLWHDDRLLNLANGRSVQVGPDHLGDADYLAQLCVGLLQNSEESSALLLLPPAEFVATTVELPGLSRESLISALRLQADALLPSLEQKLMVAVNPATTAAHTRHVAIWITEARLDQWFAAFERQGIFLSAVLPRNLLNLPGEGRRVALDEDATSLTLVTTDNGSISEWLHVSKVDLEQELFRLQWQQAMEKLQEEPLAEYHNATDYQGTEMQASAREYCLFPRGALNAERRVEKGKRLAIAAGLACLVLFLGAVPFLWQSVKFRSLAAELERNREFAADARADRTVVQQFEDLWGPVNDFPEQNLREAMFTLQNILTPDRLTSIDVVDGVIRIEGDSSEPQQILQRLEQDPMFTEVAFSRATSNNRYYIELRLSAVNFEGYMVRYFPDN